MVGAAVVFLLFVFYIGMAVLGLYIFYLIIREAINRSRLNDHLMAIHSELERLNAYLQSRPPGGDNGGGR